MFSKKYMLEHIEIADAINPELIELCVDALVDTKQNNGRLFIIGVGGSAGNASHACNDFRKLCDLEAYAPTDNVSELTARTNDEGWDTVFSEWLKTSKLNNTDAVLLLSVGGGNKEKGVSVNLINAVDFACQKGAKILSIVGRDDGYAAQKSDICIVVPMINPKMITPHSESYQSVIWHCIVSHPSLQARGTKW